MRIDRSLLGGLAALLVAASLAACGDRPSASEVGVRRIRPLSSVAIPQELAGLRVEREDVSAALAKFRTGYVKEAALYSARTPQDVVQATLQVGLLQPGERYSSSAFRRTFVNQVGGTTPKATRMGEITVWRTTGTKQVVAIWFRGRHLFLLSVREEFDRPRTMIREAVGIRA